MNWIGKGVKMDVTFNGIVVYVQHVYAASVIKNNEL